MMNRVELNDEMKMRVSGGEDGLEKVVKVTNDVVYNVVLGPITKPIDWAHRFINWVLD